MCLFCTNLKWFGPMKTGLWAKEVAEISILLVGNYFPLKMGGDFSKLCVAQILAFICTYKPETYRDLSNWGDLHNV